MTYGSLKPKTVADRASIYVLFGLIGFIWFVMMFSIWMLSPLAMPMP